MPQVTRHTRRRRPTPRYEFTYGEPALVLELFLPKRAEFQTLLYDTINKGFDIHLVKRHLNKHWRRIGRLLKDSFPGGRHFRSEVRTLDEFPNLFGGYSLFEVDGAFERASQERTQIIRIFFLPPLAEIARKRRLNLEAVRFSTQRFLRHWTHDRDEYRAELHADPPAKSTRRALAMDQEDRLIDELERWLGRVHLFTVGYVVDAISSGIGDLYRRRVISTPEKEIWIGSFRDVAVSRVRRAH